MMRLFSSREDREDRTRQPAMDAVLAEYKAAVVGELADAIEAAAPEQCHRNPWKSCPQCQAHLQALADARLVREAGSPP